MVAWRKKNGEVDSLINNTSIHRELFLNEDIAQVRWVFAIVAIWVLGYVYVDYLAIGNTNSFYLLSVLRSGFFLASIGLIIRLQKTKKENFYTQSVFLWTLALVFISILAAKERVASIEYILTHYVLLVGIYLFLPNHLILQIIPCIPLTVVDIYILVSQKPGYTQDFVFTSIITFIVINIIGIISTHQRDFQRKYHALIRETMIKGQVELKELAAIDYLTNIYNRRSFLELAEIELDRFKRYQTTFSFMMLDIDHLKKINDTYGHPVGDAVIQQFSQILQNELRSSDILGRLAGDEFGVIFPNTNAEEAANFIQRILNANNKLTFAILDKHLPIGFSAGITESKATDESLDDLYRRADIALYAVKQSGRHAVETI